MIVSNPLTNQAYGFPRGKERRVEPVALAVIHITGNSKTAAYADLHRAAIDERAYANRAGSDGPSSHYYVARDGWAIEAIDPVRFAAWSNGDVMSPHYANPGIVDVLRMQAAGFNANEAYWLEFECVGYSTTYPITAAQKDLVAEVIASHAQRTGMAISRRTVHGHWEINGINRRNCPAPYAQRETFLADVIERAKALLGAEEDVRFVNTNGFGVSTTRTVKVPKGTPIRSLTGERLFDAPSDLTLDAIGQGDAKTGEVVVQVEASAFPYPDGVARPTIYLVRLQDPAYTDVPGPYKQGYAAAKAAAGRAVEAI